MNQHAKNLRSIQVLAPTTWSFLSSVDKRDVLDAADEIERLEKENALLRRSLIVATRED